ncbi:MAG: D-alanyl-D-alanine carboxypeptidase, partial [Prevotella sp.]|nr:D-alanyl-D-alanine carboxypeptidase [Prevotella sp.]
MKTIYLSKHWVVLAVSVVLFAGCSCDNKQKEKNTTNQPKQQEIPVDKALQQRLADFANKPRAKGAFGFQVYDLTADKPVYGYNQNVSQPSASCLKLLSGVAGLRLLGTKYLYRSTIYTRGKVVRDT